MKIRLILSSIVAAFFFTACASATSDSGGDKASVVQAKQSDVQDTEMTQVSETKSDKDRRYTWQYYFRYEHQHRLDSFHHSH